MTCDGRWSHRRHINVDLRGTWVQPRLKKWDGPAGAGRRRAPTTLTTAGRSGWTRAGRERDRGLIGMPLPSFSTPVHRITSPFIIPTCFAVPRERGSLCTMDRASKMTWPKAPPEDISPSGPRKQQKGTIHFFVKTALQHQEDHRISSFWRLYLLRRTP